MSKVDWSKAPDGAEFYAGGIFYTQDDGILQFYCKHGDWWAYTNDDKASLITRHADYEERLQQWPESEERVDIIGTNGGDGMHYDEFREDWAEAPIGSKYNRLVIGIDGQKAIIDVYRVLDAFKTESAAIDHAVKKLLCAGIRHQKDRKQDLEEAIKSIQAELLLMSQR